MKIIIESSKYYKGVTWATIELEEYDYKSRWFYKKYLMSTKAKLDKQLKEFNYTRISKWQVSSEREYRTLVRKI